MSVRFGATCDPRRPTRWHFVHAPLPSNTARPRSDVAGLHRGRVERVHVAKVGDDARHVGVVERKGRHPGGLRAGPDEAGEVAIGDGVSILAAAQIHAADSVTLSAVADGAASRVEARAVRDIDVGILAIVELGCLLCRHRHRADRRSDDHQDCEVNHFLHGSSPWHEREKTARVVDGDLADQSARNCRWTFSVARSLRASQYSPARRMA